MLVTLEPKHDFQKHEDQTKEFRAVVDSVAFKECCHKAIAEFVLKIRPSTEEMQGVRLFLDVLLNMGEKSEPHERQPFMKSIASLPTPQPKK